LIAEIASSSLAEDRKIASVYGNAGIPVYWIVNLVDRQVEVYWNPRRNGYADHKVYFSGDTVPVVIDGQVVGQIAVDHLLPSPPLDSTRFVSVLPIADPFLADQGQQ
jgi:Putative restriction endonuclease